MNSKYVTIIPFWWRKYLWGCLDYYRVHFVQSGEPYLHVSNYSANSHYMVPIQPLIMCAIQTSKRIFDFLPLWKWTMWRQIANALLVFFGYVHPRSLPISVKTLGLGSNSILWEPLRNTWRSASQRSHKYGDIRVSQIWQPLLTSLSIEPLSEGISISKYEPQSTSHWPGIWTWSFTI